MTATFGAFYFLEEWKVGRLDITNLPLFQLGRTLPGT
jgi:hypothetical protein